MSEEKPGILPEITSGEHSVMRDREAFDVYCGDTKPAMDEIRAVLEKYGIPLALVMIVSPSGKMQALRCGHPLDVIKLARMVIESENFEPPGLKV